jgi:glycosyltransferase involved in cell wall biosynthesis
MKVLIMQPVNFSGVFYYAAQLADQLTKRGVDLKVVTCKNFEEEPVKSLSFSLLPIMCGMNREESRLIRALKYLLSQARVFFLILKWQPAIIHYVDIFVPLVDLLTLTFARLCNTRVVVTVHDVQPSQLTSRRFSLNHSKFILHLIYRSANRLITHSDGSRRELNVCFNIPYNKMIVSYLGGAHFQKQAGLGIDEAEARRVLNISSREKVILFFGNLKRAKGLEYALQAMPLLIKHQWNVRLLIVGPARSKSENDFDYEGLIDELGIKERIRFVKRFVNANQVHLYFKACDVVIVPYTKVYQSSVVMQAYTFAKPVVASNIEGLKDVVIDHETGFLFEAKNVDDLALKITYVFENPDHARRIAESGEALLKGKHSWENISEINSSVYQDLLYGSGDPKAGTHDLRSKDAANHQGRVQGVLHDRS